MTPLIVFLAVLIAANVYFLIHNLRYNNKVTQREFDLDDREEQLKQELDNVSSLQATLAEGIERQLALEESQTYTASYTVTESEELKYSTEEAVRRAAIKSMRFAIANDISNKFEPSVERVQGGRIKYVYKFKVVEI